MFCHRNRLLVERKFSLETQVSTNFIMFNEIQELEGDWKRWMWRVEENKWRWSRTRVESKVCRTFDIGSLKWIVLPGIESGHFTSLLICYGYTVKWKMACFLPFSIDFPLCRQFCMFDQVSISPWRMFRRSPNEGYLERIKARHTWKHASIFEEENYTVKSVQ